MEFFLGIILLLILSPFIAVSILSTILFFFEFISNGFIEKYDKWIGISFIILTPLVFIYLIYPSFFTPEFFNNFFTSAQTFLGLLITNYKLGFVMTILSLLYLKVIPVSSSRDNLYTNCIYLFIFLYTFCFLVFSGIPLDAGFNYIESSGLMDYGGPIALLIKVILFFGPYIVYSIILLLILILWIHCSGRVLFPKKNYHGKNN